METIKWEFGNVMYAEGTEDIKEFCVATTGFASKRYLNNL